MSILWSFVAFLALIVVAVGAVLWFAGQWYLRRVAAKRPSSQILHRVTRTGIVLLSLMTITMCAGAISREVAPESSVGALLATHTGWAGAMVVVVVIFACLGHVLERLGYPSFRPREERAV